VDPFRILAQNKGLPDTVSDQFEPAPDKEPEMSDIDLNLPCQRSERRRWDEPVRLDIGVVELTNGIRAVASAVHQRLPVVPSTRALAS
jgi:hypothetical protein